MPIYKHDCENCIFLGTFVNKFDFYVCNPGSLTPSYFIRMSSSPSDYLSIFVEEEDLAINCSGLSDNDKIILAMTKKAYSFILNNFKNKS